MPTLSKFVGAITNNSGQVELYIIGTDGNLWQYISSWTNLGMPAGVTSISSSALPTVIFSGKGYAYVLVIASDGNLYNWTSFGGWQNMQGAANFTAPSLIGAMNVRDGDVYVFYAAITNGNMHLWVCYWGGSAGWVWTDLQTPAGINITGQGVAMFSGVGSPYAFVKALDGNLWYNYWTGNDGWNWQNAGQPTFSITTLIPVGGLSLNDGDTHAFFLNLQGDDHIWCNRYQDGVGFVWTDFGKPNSPFGGGILSLNMVAIKGSDGNAYIFVLGQADSLIWCCTVQNDTGSWQQLSTSPANFGANNTYAAAATGTTKPTLYVSDNTGKVWVASWYDSGNFWIWSAQPLN